MKTPYWIKLLTCSFLKHNWKRVPETRFEYHCHRCDSKGNMCSFWLDGMMKVYMIDRPIKSWFALDRPQVPSRKEDWEEIFKSKPTE